MRVSVASLRLSIPRYHIDYWRKTGLLSAGGELGFQDLRRMQLIWACRKGSLNLQRIRRLFGGAELPDLKPESGEFGLAFRIDGELFCDPEASQYALVPRPAEAEGAAGKVIAFKKKEAPDSSPAISALEEAYAAALASDDRRTLMKILEQILKINPKHPGALIEKGNLAFDDGKLERAVSFYEKAAQLNPDCTEAFYNCANAYFKQGKYAPAIRYFQQCIRLEPEFPESHFNLGVLYLKLGHAEQAAACFQEYLVLDPDSDWGEQARGFLEEIELSRQR
jgi:tetratricopeptide (TPR) repeat protein